MTRLEELASKLADDDLAAEEAQELDQLLASEPQVAREFFALLDVEAVLRGERARVELSRPILKAIEREREERVQRGVIREIKKHLESGVRPVPVPAPVAEAAVIKPPLRPRARPMPRKIVRSNPWGHWMNAAVAAAVLLAVGLWFLWPKPMKPNDSTAGGGPAIRQTTDKPKPKDGIDTPNENSTPVIREASTDKIIFDEDFAKGIPEGWLCGKLENTNLPPGAKAAIKQIVKPNVNHFGVYSQRIPAGLTDTTREDTFHFTFKADTREDYRLILHLQDAADPARGGQISYDIINNAPGWRTIDAPISKFFGVTALGGKKARLTGYQFETTPFPDIGLAISRIWITRPQSKERAPP